MSEIQPVLDTGETTTTKALDNHEEDIYDESITEEVVYISQNSPQFTETRAIFIGNLRPPFDHNDLRSILDEYCQLGSCTIERAWLNTKFSHSIVITSDVPGAESIRKELNGKVFPNSGETIGQLPLFVEFIPVKATQLWIDQEINGPKDGIWKVSFKSVPSKKVPGTTFTVATHTMVNHSNETWGYKSSSRKPRRMDKRRLEIKKSKNKNRDHSPIRKQQQPSS